MRTEPVFLVSAARTAIGGFGGSLIDTAPAELGAIAFKEALRRARVPEGATLDEVILGNVLAAGQGMNLARQVCLKSGLAIGTPAYTVNKVCGSGLKAIALAAAEISCGNAQCIAAGGVESMSQAGYVSLGARWGSRLGHGELRDLILQDGLTDVFNSCHMGITAENLAERYGISREAQDEFAYGSQLKAQAALASGAFSDEVVAVPLMKRGKVTGTFQIDEHPRKDCTLESLKSLRPAFKKDGTVTAGNASGINDGAAAVVLASKTQADAWGVSPLAEILGWASAAVEPEVMGIGPVGAVKKVLAKTGVSIEQVDLIEANEAFAAQALAVNKLLEWDVRKVNVCGGAIALGHPIGASGARILVTLVHQLRRANGSLGLATLCVGGGQGIAILIRTV